MAQRPGALRVEHVEPFVAGVVTVLAKEVGVEARRGALSVARTGYLTNDVTIVVGVTGPLRGIVLYGLSKDTAREIASRMMGEPVPELHYMAQSAIAELGNIVTGLAATALSERGLRVNICPPGLLLGKQVLINTFEGHHRLVVPFKSPLGAFTVDLALEVGS